MKATKTRFDPFDGLKQKQLDEARTRNAQRDAADRASGFSAPGDSSLDLWVRTAMSALAAGIEMRDMDSLYESLAMLQDIEAKLRRE